MSTAGRSVEDLRKTVYCSNGPTIEFGHGTPTEGAFSFTVEAMIGQCDVDKESGTIKVECQTNARNIQRLSMLIDQMLSEASDREIENENPIRRGVDLAVGARELPIVGQDRDPWKHRSSGMSCATCMWYVPKVARVDAGEAVKIGRCRRHAPTMNGYPAVFPNDWCGDHKLDETKL